MVYHQAFPRSSAMETDSMSIFAQNSPQARRQRHYLIQDILLSFSRHAQGYIVRTAYPTSFTSRIQSTSASRSVSKRHYTALGHGVSSSCSNNQQSSSTSHIACRTVDAGTSSSPFNLANKTSAPVFERFHVCSQEHETHHGIWDGYARNTSGHSTTNHISIVRWTVRLPPTISS
jgi:hypothetical protein